MKIEVEKPNASDISLQASRFIVSNSPEMIFWTDIQGRMIDFNDAACSILGYSREELSRMSVADFDPEITPENHAVLLARLANQSSVTVQAQPRRKDGSYFRMEFFVQRFEIGGQFYICTRGREIDLEKQLRNQVLEALATGLPLADILNLIIELAEKTRTGMIGSIMLLDESGKYRIGSDTRLSEEVRLQNDGSEPDSNLGSSVTNVSNVSRAFVSGISTSPILATFPELAESERIRACWAEPIFSPDKQVLGKLAMCFPKPLVPTQQDRDLIKTLAHLAGIAINHAYRQEKLQKSEIRNRSLVQSTSATVWTTSPEGTFVSPQESWESYTGQTWEQYKGFGWKDAIHEEDRDRLLRDWTTALRTQETCKTYGRVWHAASGEYRHFEAHATPIFKENRIVEWVGCTTDVHDRKIAKIGIERIKTSLAEAQSAANMGSWEWIFESDRIFWTEEFCRLHGIDLDCREGDPEALIGTVFFEDRQSVWQAIQTMIETGDSLTMEYRIAGQHESIRTVISKMKFEKDAAGNHCGMIGTVLDVTDLRRAEDAVRRSERQLRMITDSLPVRIAYIDTNYCFQFSNALYETVYNRPRTEIDGRHISHLIGQAEFSEAKKYFDAAFQGTPSSYERRTDLPGQGAKIIEVRLIPDFTTDGQVKGVYSLVDDITQRRALEKEVTGIAESEHRRIGQDLHDGIGQELTGLGMIADTLLLSLSRNVAPEQKLAEKLARGIKRALGQVKGLARGLDPVDISPAGLTSALTQMAQHVTDLYGIRCRFNCESIVQIDDHKVATQLFRIAQEATTNAAKHGNAENITISLAAEREIVSLSIGDDGEGIDLSDEHFRGMGIRTMHYRAGIIGGKLAISGRNEGGTLVQCRLPRIDTFSDSSESLSFSIREDSGSNGERSPVPDLAQD